MMEWNNDEISKLIDFSDKGSFMYIIRHFSGARNSDELASNFSCKFLVTVSVACVADFSFVWFSLHQCFFR